MASLAPALEVTRVSKSVNGKPLLKGVSFSVKGGEVFGLLGPNGAGKSTLLGILSGLYPLEAGSVKFGGQSLSALGKRLHSFLGVVPQDDYFYFPFTVEENLRFFGVLNGLSGAALAKRVSYLIDWLDLRQFRRTRAERLSGGYKRLLNIACSVVHDPEIIFFDEPTVALDPNARHLFWRKIGELKRQGKALVLTTHYMDEAQALCDNISILFKGEVLASGSPKQLIDRFGGERILAVRASADVDLEREKAVLAGIKRLLPKSEVKWKKHYLFVSLPAKAQFEAVAKVIAFIEEKGIKVVSQQLKEPELEDVFLHLTGERHLQTGVKNVAESK